MTIKSLPSDKKIHMLIVIRWPVGGIRTFCRYVYNYFDSNRFQFTILAPDFEEVRTLVQEFKPYNVRWISSTDNRYSSHFSVLTVFKVIVRGDYDVIHSHGLSAGAFCAAPAKFAGIPHIMTSHDVFTQKQFRSLMGKVKKILLSKALLMVDTIHHVSYDAKDNMLDSLPVLNRINSKNIVSRNGIMVSQFLLPQRRDYHKELGLHGDIFLLGFMGRFMAQKGFKYLIEAVDIIVKNKITKRFKILCFGWGGFIREEQCLIQAKGLQDYFIFLPFIDNIASSLKGLDVLVMPSLWEACPLLPMEAMVSGVPIIGTDCVGLREVLKVNEVSVSMIPTGDSRALSEAIIGEMKNSVKENAEKYVEKACSLFDVRRQAMSIEKRVVSMAVN